MVAETRENLEMSGGQTREAIKFLNKCTILVMALATVAPAFALPPAGLSDSGQPGNVVIYPKFVNLPAVNVDGNVVPRTEIEIGAVCPAGIVCAEHQSVTVHFQWICPGAEGVNSTSARGRALTLSCRSTASSPSPPTAFRSMVIRPEFPRRHVRAAI